MPYSNINVNVNVSVNVSIGIAHHQSSLSLSNALVPFNRNVFSRRLKAASVEFGFADRVRETVPGARTNNGKSFRAPTKDNHH